MRTDHYAYQRAAKVAGLGFLLQAGVGLSLLVFGRLAGDTTLLFSSIYVLLGLIVWLSLVVVFHQQKLERLEALEEDEMAAARSGTSSVFDAAAEETRVAAKRLRLMYAWLMPGVSLALPVLLGVLAFVMIQMLRNAGTSAEASEFIVTSHRGWAIAICLAFAAVSFIFSRFVAGMAKQPAWHNLRGGAAYMVGNALVLLAVAVGVVFRFFQKDTVSPAGDYGFIGAVAYAIPVFMILLAAEITLNFILNIYRPRVPGEVPRPAFDSKLLSLLAAPDSLVRSLNEAINYQFGFDVTSSWGYQLLLRSFGWLIGLGLLALMLLNTMVIVEPHQQAVKLSGGRIVGDVHGSGVMWKLPWPLQTANVYDVTRIRELPLAAQRVGRGGETITPTERTETINLWSAELNTDREIEPFLVRSEPLVLEGLHRLRGRNVAIEADQEAEGEDRVSDSFALVDAEVLLAYRILRDGGLLDYLHFASDVRSRRSEYTEREHAIKALALREISQHLSKLTLNDVLASRRASLAAELRQRVQDAFDRHRTGIEVVAVSMPLARPAGDAAPSFEELGKSHQARLEKIALAERGVTATFTFWMGDADLFDEALTEIERWERMVEEHGADAPETNDQRTAVERLLFRGGGNAAQLIAEAERDRWVSILAKRAQAQRLNGQVLAYRAAPDLYRQREMMRVFVDSLATVRKYILGIDPSRINIDVELQERNPILDFSPTRKPPMKEAPNDKPIAIVAGLLLLVLLILFSMTYTVQFYQVAITSRFGHTSEESIVSDAGLKFRLPFFAERVKKFDRRLQLIESGLETIPTADDQQVVVRAFLLWQIDSDSADGPLRFLENFNSPEMAQRDLTNSFLQSLSVLSRYRFDELVGQSSRLPDAEAAILAQLTSALDEGVRPVTVGISQMMLPPATTSGVLTRMNATRTRLSEAERFKGDAEAKRVQSDAEILADKIVSFAEQRAAQIRGAGDEKAAEFLAQMSVDEELAIFLVWLDALEQSLGNNTTVVLDTAFAPWHLLKIDDGGSGIPLPEGQEVIPPTEPLAARDEPGTAATDGTDDPIAADREGPES